MGEGWRGVAKTAITDYLPVSSLRKAWEILTDQDWTLFLYRFSLIGLVLLSLGMVLQILTLQVFLPTANSSTPAGFITSALGNATFFGVVSLIFAYLIKMPVSGVTDDISPSVSNLKYPRLGKFIAVVVTSLLIVYCLAYRMIITQIEIESDVIFARILGNLVGFVVLDMTYFGGLMTGVGMLLFVLLDDADESSESDDTEESEDEKKETETDERDREKVREATDG
mgnify:CR=1 FL=1